jgi:hypothetical protein
MREGCRAGRVTGWVWEKIAQNEAKFMFYKKLCVTFFRGPKIFVTPEFFKKPAQRKQSPNTIRKLTQYISENSPNLVALSCVTRVIWKFNSVQAQNCIASATQKFLPTLQVISAAPTCKLLQL